MGYFACSVLSSLVSLHPVLSILFSLVLFVNALSTFSPGPSRLPSVLPILLLSGCPVPWRWVDVVECSGCVEEGRGEETRRVSEPDGTGSAATGDGT